LRDRRAVSSWRCRITLLSLCVAVSGLVAGSANADEATRDSKLAHDLFDQGRTLLKQGDYERACQKFEDSRRLAPEGGGGTILNLALCRELSGRTGTAWALFREARSQALRDHRNDRLRFADEHIAALAERISRLTIIVPLNGRAPGLVVRLNMVPLTESAWGESLVVDPGVQSIDVTAPKKQSVHLEVSMGTHADRRVVEVPPLSDLPQKAVTTDRGHPSFLSGPGRTWGTILVTVGVATLAVGGLLNVRAARMQRDSDALCPDYDRCDPLGLTLSKGAASEASASTAVLVTGAVATVAGVILFLTAPSSPPSPGERRADAWRPGPWMLTF
jgi:hypothetical protein